MAALLALANQQRQQQVPPLPTLSSAETLNAIYTLGTGPNSSSYFHSVASGSSGANSAATGYNLATGVGSPVANSLVAALGGSFANAPSAKTGSGATTTTTSPGGTTPRMGVLFVTIEFFLDANAFKPSAVQTGNNSIGYVAPPASMPFFMTQTLAAPPPRRFVYLVGERLDPSDDDGGDMTAAQSLAAGMPSTASAQMSTLQVWARYSPAPVVEEGTWASAVDNVSGHELADRYELYPERQRSWCLAAKGTFAGPGFPDGRGFGRVWCGTAPNRQAIA